MQRGGTRGGKTLSKTRKKLNDLAKAMGEAGDEDSESSDDEDNESGEDEEDREEDSGDDDGSDSQGDDSATTASDNEQSFKKLLRKKSRTAEDPSRDPVHLLSPDARAARKTIEVSTGPACQYIGSYAHRIYPRRRICVLPGAR